MKVNSNVNETFSFYERCNKPLQLYHAKMSRNIQHLRKGFSNPCNLFARIGLLFSGIVAYPILLPIAGIGCLGKIRFKKTSTAPRIAAINSQANNVKGTAVRAASPPRPPQPQNIPKQTSPVLSQQLNIAQNNLEGVSAEKVNTVPSQQTLAKTGLSNIGNTCFMNAALQAYINVPSLRRKIIETPVAPIPAGLTEQQHRVMIAKMHLQIDLKTLLGLAPNRYAAQAIILEQLYHNFYVAGGREVPAVKEQADAEFIVRVLSDVYLTKFTGEVQATNKSYEITPHMLINLEDVQSAFLFQEAVVEKFSHWQIKSALPDQIVIKNCSNGAPKKAQIGLLNDFTLKDNNHSQQRYVLASFITRVGDTEYSGHYYTYAYDGKNWCKYDDSTVSIVSLAEVQKQVPTHVIYERKASLQLQDTKRIGLANLGNTCFMNSSIQAIINVPELREKIVNASISPVAKELCQQEAKKLVAKNEIRQDLKLLIALPANASKVQMQPILQRLYENFHLAHGIAVPQQRVQADPSFIFSTLSEMYMQDVTIDNPLKKELETRKPAFLMNLHNITDAKSAQETFTLEFDKVLAGGMVPTSKIYSGPGKWASELPGQIMIRRNVINENSFKNGRAEHLQSFTVKDKDNVEQRYVLKTFAVRAGETLAGGHLFAYAKENGAWHLLDDMYVVEKPAAEVLQQIPATLLYERVPS